LVLFVFVFGVLGFLLTIDQKREVCWTTAIQFETKQDYRITVRCSWKHDRATFNFLFLWQVLQRKKHQKTRE